MVTGQLLGYSKDFGGRESQKNVVLLINKLFQETKSVTKHSVTLHICSKEDITKDSISIVGINIRTWWVIGTQSYF